MPCTPAKARHLFKSGKAKPKRNKLGLFYVQLCYEQEPDNQPLVVGVDPGSKFEGFSVVGTLDTVTNLMVEAPEHVKEAVETRRTMRRARRFRKWRRPKRFDNRLNRKERLPPPHGAAGRPRHASWRSCTRSCRSPLWWWRMYKPSPEEVQDASGMRPSALCKSAKSTSTGSCARWDSRCTHGKAGRPKSCETSSGSRKPRASPSSPSTRMRSTVGCWQHRSVVRKSPPVSGSGMWCPPACIGGNCICCKHHQGECASPMGARAPWVSSEGRSSRTPSMGGPRWAALTARNGRSACTSTKPTSG